MMMGVGVHLALSMNKAGFLAVLGWHTDEEDIENKTTNWLQLPMRSCLSKW
jgi:hypothetical protein